MNLFSRYQSIDTEPNERKYLSYHMRSQFFMTKRGIKESFPFHREGHSSTGILDSSPVTHQIPEFTELTHESLIESRMHDF